jgi:hypothetical protein
MLNEAKHRVNEIQDIATKPLEKIERSILKWLKVDFNVPALIVSLLIFVAAAALFLQSGFFVAGVMLDDTLLYTESGYRLANGQWPGINFTSAMGALWYLPLAIVFRLNGDLVAAIPISFVIFASVVFGLAVYVAWTRLSAILGAFVISFCSIFVMAPWAVGHKISPQGSTHTTAAEGYNRLGFTLILLVTLLAVVPKSGRREAIASRGDVLFALIAFALAFYTKMPFGLGVAGMFFLWAAILTNDRRQLLKFVVGVAILIGVVEIALPGLHTGYLREMSNHAQVTPVFTARPILRAIYETTPELIAVAGLPILALATQGYCDWRHLIFFASLMAGSIILLTLSYQGPYLIAPMAVSVVAVSMLTRPRGETPERMAVWAAAAAFAFGFWTYFFPAANAIIRHAWYANRSVPIENMPRSYASLRVPSDIDLEPMESAFTNRLSGEQAYAAARSKDPLSTVNALFDNEYARTLTDLPNAQPLCGKAKERTAILDFANVSSSLLGHAPAGGYAYAHFLRGFSEAVHWPADEMFSGVDCLFDPKLPDAPDSRNGLWLVYGSMIQSSFTPNGESKFWRVFVRNGRY